MIPNGLDIKSLGRLGLLIDGVEGSFVFVGMIYII